MSRQMTLTGKRAKKQIRLIVGIEIETEYNMSMIGCLRRSGYHSSEISPYSQYFTVERDCTVNANKFVEGGEVEIISVPFYADDWHKIFNAFKQETHRLLKIKKGHTNVPFHEIFNFNRSMGCHIHITPVVVSSARFPVRFRGNRFVFHGKPIFFHGCGIHHLNQITEKLKTNMKSVFSLAQHRVWSAHLYRNHAKKIDREQFNDKYCSWNYEDMPRTHLEYRSFNLLGCKTWEQFYKMVGVALTTIQTYIQKEINKKNPFLLKTEVKEKIETTVMPPTTFQNTEVVLSANQWGGI